MSLNLSRILSAARRGAAVAVLSLALAAPALAQTAGKTAKIGVVDFEQVVRRSRTIQSAVKQAESQLRPQQDKVEAKMREMQSLSQSLSDKSSVLKADDLSSEKERLRAMRQEVDELQFEINKRYERIQSEVMEPEVKRIGQAVENIARAEGFDLVLRSEAVLFHSDAVDLTPMVIQTLDRQSASAAKPAAASDDEDAPEAARASRESKSSEKPARRGLLGRKKSAE